MAGVKTEPLVSVVLITYNHSRYIGQALDNILGQQVDFPFEVVVADDCSTDTTPEIIARYQQQFPDRVRVLPNTVNVGVSRNVERGVLGGRGKYTAIIEGDDYWVDSSKLQRQVDFMEAHADYSMCFHNALVVYEDDPSRQSHLMNTSEKTEYTLEDITKGWFIPTASIMFRSSSLLAFPAWFHESEVGDLPLVALLAAKGRVGYLPRQMSVYRVHAKGVTRAGNREGFLLRLGRMLEHLDAELGYKYHRNLMRKGSDNYFILAGTMLEDNQPGKAYRYYLQALRCKLAARELPTAKELKSFAGVSARALRAWAR
jgi:glycosyltransferase involved in cell wall biosynthesis